MSSGIAFHMMISVLKRDDLVKFHGNIPHDIRICIFIDGHTRSRMRYENNVKTVLNTAFSNNFLDLTIDIDELKTKELIPIYTTQVFNDGSVEFKRTTYKRVVDEAVKDEIMKMIVENDVNMTDFKAFVKKYTNATDEDFNKYDETLLEALKIYISRRDEPAL